MTKKEAIRLSIVKWKFFSKKSYSDNFKAYCNLRENKPEVKGLFSNCGLCEYSYSKNEKSRIYNESFCMLCPLFKQEGTTCTQKGNPYYFWTRDPTKENAIKMLKTIRKL